ncbi:MAG: hypothetical protein HKN85_02675 [Gammaproteobacteria bacterium]|nr:hypothetical protein [Gammaproteobacteria bacterium]
MNNFTKIFKQVFNTLIFISFSGFFQFAYSQNLWEGEEYRKAKDYPFITKLLVVDKDAPLVVFTPGKGALARVGYGGHEGGLQQDFLAHWLNELGYNFLGISYPLLTKGHAFEEAEPTFTVRAWGRGMAEITRDIRQEQGLTGRIIHTAWSMGGKSAQPFSESAKALGLELDFFVSLASTPPIPGILGMNAEAPKHQSGLVKLPESGPTGDKGLKPAETIIGRVIIPHDVLLTDYLGHTPVQLVARGLRFNEENNEFVRDHWADMQDTKFYDIDNFPMVAMIIPQDKYDHRHTLTDRATWGYYITHKMLRLAGSAKQIIGMDDAKFARLSELVNSAPDRLAVNIEGNHFFFIGEHGAKATAEAIKVLDGRMANVKREFEALVAD